MSQSTLADYESTGAKCPTCGEAFDSPRAVKAHHQHHDKPYYDVVVERQFGVSPERFVRKHHRDRGLPLIEVGEMIGGSEQAARDMCERHGVEMLSLSEAKEAEWERLDASGRESRLGKAHETTRELVKNDDHNFQDPEFERVQPPGVKRQQKKRPEALIEWVQNNPEKLSAFAALGADAREQNGMEGVTGEDHHSWTQVEVECSNCGKTVHRKPSHVERVDDIYCRRQCYLDDDGTHPTGQDHPRWRGGVSLIDAVKKQLRPSFTETRETCHDKPCRSCGETEGYIDAHHIIPVSVGGTNVTENLMPLCRSCHTKADAYLRQYPEFNSVLTE